MTAVNIFKNVSQHGAFGEVKVRVCLVFSQSDQSLLVFRKLWLSFKTFRHLNENNKMKIAFPSKMRGTMVSAVDNQFMKLFHWCIMFRGH